MLHAKRVPLDDNAKALYTHGEKWERNFYGGLHPQPYSLTPNKTLYAFYPKNTKSMGVLIFFDKYGQKWKLLEEAELETYLHMGVPVSFYFKEGNKPKKASTSKGSAHVDFADDYKKPPNDSK